MTSRQQKASSNIILHCLLSLHVEQWRKATNIEGLQFVHREVLQYLQLANKYSNSAQGLSEYLGRT
jgi:hypothetical protein